MFLIHVHRFGMGLLLFSMCLPNCSWLISLPRHRHVFSIDFSSPNSVFLTHHEFEGGVRCICTVGDLPFLLGGFLYIFPFLYLYIYGPRAPVMNTSTSAIPNNSNCSTVEVAKCPHKIVISAGWAAFVDTYDLHLHGSVLFRYGENSEFYVVIFDQFGCEEVLSVLEDYSHLPPHDPERCIDATEAVKCCESCKKVDEYKYYNLGNEEKYFLVFMEGDFQHEMVSHGSYQCKLLYLTNVHYL
ncbi:hypothetical protein SEVIR_9G164532v4 [Setaria viridis]